MMLRPYTVMFAVPVIEAIETVRLAPVPPPAPSTTCPAAPQLGERQSVIVAPAGI